MALYKGLYLRSRQAGSLSSAGAQQGAGLARLADCAHWGLLEWHGWVDGDGEREREGCKQETVREQDKEQNQVIVYNRDNKVVIFAFVIIFLLSYIS